MASEISPLSESQAQQAQQALESQHLGALTRKQLMFWMLADAITDAYFRTVEQRYFSLVRCLFRVKCENDRIVGECGTVADFALLKAFLCETFLFPLRMEERDSTFTLFFDDLPSIITQLIKGAVNYQMTVLFLNSNLKDHYHEVVHANKPAVPLLLGVRCALADLKKYISRLHRYSFVEDLDQMVRENSDLQQLKLAVDSIWFRQP